MGACWNEGSAHAHKEKDSAIGRQGLWSGTQRRGSTRLSRNCSNWGEQIAHQTKCTPANGNRGSSVQGERHRRGTWSEGEGVVTQLHPYSTHPSWIQLQISNPISTSRNQLTTSHQISSRDQTSTRKRNEWTASQTSSNFEYQIIQILLPLTNKEEVYVDDVMASRNSQEERNQQQIGPSNQDFISHP